MPPQLRANCVRNVAHLNVCVCVFTRPLKHGYAGRLHVNGCYYYCHWEPTWFIITIKCDYNSYMASHKYIYLFWYLTLDQKKKTIETYYPAISNIFSQSPPNPSSNSLNFCAFISFGIKKLAEHIAWNRVEKVRKMVTMAGIIFNFNRNFHSKIAISYL